MAHSKKMKNIFVCLGLIIIYQSHMLATTETCLQLFSEKNSGEFKLGVDTAYTGKKNTAAINEGDEVTLSQNGSASGRYVPGLIGSNISIYYQPAGPTLAERVLVKKIIFKNGIAVGFQAVRFQALTSATEVTYLFKDINIARSFINYRYRYFLPRSEVTTARPRPSGDYYEILRVPYDATSEQIHEAYYRMIMQYDSDRGVSPESAHKFATIKEAYEILMNPDLRRQFDKIRY